MKKLTNDEFDELSREEKRKAILEFREPNNIHRPHKWVKENKD